MNDILDDVWEKRHPKDALFLSIIDGYEIKEFKLYPDVIYFMKNNIILFEYRTKTKYTSINHNLIWLVFKTKFNLNYI